MALLWVVFSGVVFVTFAHVVPGQMWYLIYRILIFAFLFTLPLMLNNIYHMTLLLFSEKHREINNVMITRYITLPAETSNVMTTSVTTMQIFMEINTL